MSQLDYSFSNDYMVLRPDKAGVLDMLQLLCSSKVWKNRAVDCLTGTEIRGFGRRLLVFQSLFLQVLLLWLQKPVSMIGSAAEFFMNFCLNIFIGEVAIPDQTSSTYRSITGLVDRRIKFDKSINPSVSGHDAKLSFMAAKLAYENESFIRNVISHHWQMEFLGFYNCWNEFESDYSAQAFTFRDKPVDAELVVVAFRGARPFDTARWRSDIDSSWYDVPRLGRVHAGFANALGLHRNIGWPRRIEREKRKRPRAYYAIREALRDVLEANERAKFVVTGHGSGGALAALFAAVLAYHKERKLLDRLVAVYTFGQPRVGDAALGCFVEKHLDTPDRRYFRVSSPWGDAMARLPCDHPGLRFRHFGLRLRFDSFCKWQEHEETNDDYSSLWSTICTYILSAWCLISSFLLGFWRSLLCNRWSLLFVSFVAMLLPKLPLRTIQEYVHGVIFDNFFSGSIYCSLAQVTSKEHEETNDDRSSLWSTISTYIVSSWHLISSFILGFWQSLHYKRWLPLFASFATMLLPKLPLRTIQEYVHGVIFDNFFSGITSSSPAQVTSKEHEETNDDNSSSWSTICTYIISAWHLISSFMLGFLRSLHCNRWLLLFVSFVAMLLPELPLHTIQEYVQGVSFAELKQ